MKNWVISYKGKGKGFAETSKILKAKTKKEAKDKLWDMVGGDIVIKEIKEL